MDSNKIIDEDMRHIIAHDLEWKRFENKTIIVTGANGFLPAYMVKTLLYLIKTKIVNNLKIYALVRDKNKAEKRFLNFVGDSHLHFIIQDVCEPLQLEEPIHFIIHAASQANPQHLIMDPVGTLKANVIGTINLCEIARRNPIESFLFFSSAIVYGKIEEKVTTVDELSYGYLNPTNVQSCYGESKRMGENICVSYMHQFGVPVKMVRPAHIYGPGMDLNDERVCSDFVRDIVNNQNIVMKSDGSASRSFCYLSDATIAFFRVLLDGKNGEAYNVTNPLCETTILELAEILVSLFPEKHLKVQTKNIKGKNAYGSVGIEKIKSLNWIPSVQIKEGFYKTILSYE
jgi:nucleoside-diphosphate-sugar epimerase